MLNRRPFPNYRTMADTIGRDFPLTLFRYSNHDKKVSKYGIPYNHACVLTICNISNNVYLNTTWLYASADVPYDEVSPACWQNPFLGVKSEWLKTDLGFHDAEGEFTFLFGRRETSRRSFGDPIVLEFYNINTPEDIGNATHIFVLQKIRNRDDVKTECEWRDGDRSIYRITDTSADGYYWKLTMCPMGFRQVHSSGPDKYYWEQTDTAYRTYERFVEARQDYVRTFCAKLLAAWNNGEATEALIPDEQASQGAAAKGDDNTTAASVLQEADDATSLGSVFHGIMMSRAKGRPGAGDTVSDTSNVNPKELCTQLNARLNVLRMQPGFESLESYTYDESRKSFGGVCFTLVPTAKTKHSPAQALCHVERLEYFARMRQKYIPYFEELRERISAVEGMLHTEHPQYAEIEIPAGCFDVDDKVMDHQRFSYAPKGVVAARKYVLELEKGYARLLQELNNQTEN